MKRASTRGLILLPLLLAAPLLVHAAYQPINEAWIAEWFGVGSALNGSRRFDANDANLLVWAGVFSILGAAVWWATAGIGERWRLWLRLGCSSAILAGCMIAYAREVWL